MIDRMIYLLICPDHQMGRQIGHQIKPSTDREIDHQLTTSRDHEI